MVDQETPEVYDAFISYNLKNRQQAQNLRDLFTTLGWRIWFDETDLPAGPNLDKSIANAIVGTTRFIILIGSAGVGSWQEDEISLALNQLRTGAMRTLIVLVDGTPTTAGLVPHYLVTRPIIYLQPDPISAYKTLLKQMGFNLRPRLYSPPEQGANATDGDETLPDGYSADVGKMVELLIGQSLYRRQDVCVRELMQNAVDACQRRYAFSYMDYRPKIVMRINTIDRWFEVEDNGEGMNPTQLRQSFAVLGRSVKDEVNMQNMDETNRQKVIARFGIGFVSCFMLASKVFVSTRSQGFNQINFSIKSFNERFQYSEKSLIDRAPDDIGTTVRLEIAEEHHGVDVRRICLEYARHLRGFELWVNGNQETVHEEWNTSGAILAHDYNSSDGSFSLKLAAKAQPGSFIVSNWGFLVGTNVSEVLPYFKPSWIIGEVDFRPNAIDLNIARDAVVSNDKIRVERQKLSKYTYEFLNRFVDSVSGGSFGNSLDGSQNPSTLSSIGDARKLIANYCLVVQYLHEEAAEKGKLSSDELPLNHEQATRYMQSCLDLNYGWPKKSMPIGDILASLKRRGAKKIFYKDSYLSYPILERILEEAGELVLPWTDVKVEFRGKTDGPFTARFHRLISPFLEKSGFILADLNQLDLDSLEAFSADLCERVPRAIREQMSAFKVASEPIRYATVLEADLLMRFGNKTYLNLRSREYDRFVRWCAAAQPSEIRMYILGLLQKSP